MIKNKTMEEATVEAKTKGRSFDGSDWVVECVVGFRIGIGVWIQMETFGDLAQLTSIGDAKCWRGQGSMGC